MDIKIGKKKNLKILLFLEQFQELLREYSYKNNLEYCPNLEFINFNHHSEILNISILESNGNKKSMFKFFENFYIVLESENNQLKMFLSIKDKNINGYQSIEGYLSEFKKFINENIKFEKKYFDELIMLD